MPVLKRGDVLGQLMRNSRGIAVAGTHGKTTTCGMIAHILIEGGLDPTVVLGGSLPGMGSHGRHGLGDYFVVEADEYDYMFLGLRPETAVVTNIEYDHPDVFAGPADYQAAFRQFVDLLPSDGRLVACSDDEGVQHLLADLDRQHPGVTTYGLSSRPAAGGRRADYIALESRPNQLGGTDFLVENEGSAIGVARIRVPGQHNVRNALAAIVVGLKAGLEFGVICRSLAGFGGIGRRFQVIGEVGGVTIIDDYAHHPTEIRATLAAARERYSGRPLWAVWQPHTFSRTRKLLAAFAGSFAAADHVIVLDIYRSRERDQRSVSSGDVVRAMSHPDAIHVGGLREATRHLLDLVRPHDVVLTLGAGDGNLVGQWLLTGLQERVGR